MQVNRIGEARSKFAFSQHPTDIQVYVKSNIVDGDSVTIDIFVYSGGAVVDSGNWTNTTSITNWTLQTIPVTQNTTAIDSLEIQINNRGTQGQTSISVDCFNCGITGIDDNENGIEWILLPNPLTDFAILTFDNSKKENHDLTIYGITGQLIKTITDITTGQVKIEKGDLSSGIYFFELSADRRIVASGNLTT